MSKKIKGVAPQSLIAAATRMVNWAREPFADKSLTAINKSWVAEAWDMYGQVGELRFVANLLATRLSQARLYVGEVQPGGEPVEITDNKRAEEILDAMGDAIPAMLTRMAIDLFVADGGYICGLPAEWLDTKQATGDIGDYAIEDLKWAVLSTDEVHFRNGVLQELSFEGVTFDEIDADDILLVRVWRPHPRNYREADSPVRSSLPVLRELVGLTKHVSAQIDSRLAGAGVLFVPTSVERTFSESEEDDTDTSFSASLLEAMMTPIADRDSPAAVVPLVVGVPPEDVEHIKHISMSSPLDAEAKVLRDEAIRRLALGLDCPPETLLGMGSLNHWSAWLVDEQTVSTHLKPTLTLIVDAITEHIFRPLMEASGEDASNLLIWYDTNHMMTQGSDVNIALELYDRGILGSEEVLRVAGYPPAIIESLPPTHINPESEEVVIGDSANPQNGTPIVTGTPDEGTRP